MTGIWAENNIEKPANLSRPESKGGELCRFARSPGTGLCIKGKDACLMSGGEKG